MPKFDAIDL